MNEINLRMKELELTKDNNTNLDNLFNMLKCEFLTYSSLDEFKSIKKAFDLAVDLHKDQKRKSGEAFIIHPVSVAMILAKLKLDKDIIIAGLLHDTLEDTHISYDMIKKEFGYKVALLVDGVTKSVEDTDKFQLKVNTYRKMIVNAQEDIRVFIIKLADRLHNMRTLMYQSKNKQMQISQETLEIYIPIASKLGLNIIKRELEDLVLLYLYNSLYNEVNNESQNYLSNNELFTLKFTIKKINDILINHSINFFITKKRYELSTLSFRDNFKIDIYILIVTEHCKDCYKIFDTISKNFSLIEESFKDNLNSKEHTYNRCINAFFIDNNGFIFEIKIQTFEMYSISEYGIIYKYNNTNKLSVRMLNNKEANWINEISEIENKISNNYKFFEFLKSYLKIKS